jgi:electron transport complex protein RnfB
MDIILVSAITLGGLGLVFGLGLAIASIIFYVVVDSRIEKLMELLPGINCGGCGYAGCAGFAQAIVAGKAEVTGCAPGGNEAAHEIARLLGQEAGEVASLVAVVRCQGGINEATEK